VLVVQTAYSVYSQLPFMSGGRLLNLHPEDASCRGEKGRTNIRREVISGIKMKEHLVDIINELTEKNKNKSIRDVCRGINKFKKTTNLEAA
jgi:hypothetical protein